ncbi:hypothetical protein THRCLA_10479, partial [Thraustotheca clavata]
MDPTKRIIEDMQKLPLDAYNQALRRGRHPRSFNRADTCQLWSTLKNSTSRVNSIRTGQGLGQVVSKEIEGLQKNKTRNSTSPSRGTIKDVKGSILLANGKEKRDKKNGKKKHIGHEDIIRRIQALGTIPSMQANTTTISTNNNSNDIDTTKLRHDFSSQNDARLYYGSTVAFELFNGDLMMISVTDSQVCVQPLERLKHQPKGARDKLLFTLINMNEQRSANPIQFGDSVWLQISVGTGETSWEQGGVLGAKVRKAPDLQTLSLTQDDKATNTATQNSSPEEILLTVGYPVPVKAYLPKTRDDSTDSQIDDMQARLRNKTSRMVGRWIMRSAIVKPKGKDEFVYNNDEIYLEQDWFYLGAETDSVANGQSAVLRQLPPVKATKVGEYVIERRAAWKVRLVDSSKGGLGLTLVQQQMERLLFKAKTQLKSSERMRNGQLRQYEDDLNGGQGFAKQLRRHIQHVTSECDEAYFAQQNDRLRNLDQYFEQKTNEMDKADRKSTSQLSPLPSALKTCVSAPTLNA